ncbi:HGL085Cp [Eremothecium sinecaudum]|uniref:Actin cytoskeleton-regulatory complex protein SLA1 n=1 Tax=Eremothecium sinecaudum TaxID=45286 RepID=A0A0X8HVI7_9SACH|nr:HGL085Cp [Eremothecium sinecaudum]AMD22255.1 HGL085Cp [Eremothecium sinecaudum]
MTVFLGVYRAIYAYEPQTDEELAIEEDDLLYLLEKSDVDDWWTVKKRVVGADIDEPVGLVPNNYIEEADIIYQVRALYDYEEAQNPDEELSFIEGDLFDIYDDRDADWLLCRSVKDGGYGFIPGNYVEKVEDGGDDNEAERIAKVRGQPEHMRAAEESIQTQPSIQMVPISELPPPPQRKAESSSPPVSRSSPNIPSPEISKSPSNRDVPIDGRPLPDLPSRPLEPPQLQPSLSSQQMHPMQSVHLPQSVSIVLSDEETPPPKPPRNAQPSAGYKDSVPIRTTSVQFSATWSLKEVRGRKKKDSTLTVTSEEIIFEPGDGPIQSWTYENLTSYDNEKKHLFLEFKNPYANLELYAKSSDLASTIVSHINDWKSASNGSALRELEIAKNSVLKKLGIVSFDFTGESPDELTVKEGDEIYIINDKKSPDWWMCEIIRTGRRGVIPAQFIQVVPHKGSSSPSMQSRAGSGQGNRNRSVSYTSDPGSWKHDSNQDGSKRSSVSSKKKDDKKKKKTYPKNTRIWVDRTNSFKVEAELLGYFDGKIHLHKANGVKIAVAAEKLSNDDIVFVERVTGKNLDKYKQKDSHKKSSSRSDTDAEERELDRRLRERERLGMKKDEPKLTQTVISNDNSSRNKDYDWFELFLNSGVDINSCQRYATIFERENMSEEILPSLRSATLRDLELREGDIIRVMNYLDKKFGREVKDAGAAAARQNSAPGQPTSQAPQEDDVWTARPAANAEIANSQSKKAFSGSLQDLLDLKPLEPKKKEQIPKPKLGDLEPVRTGGSIKSSKQYSSQPLQPLDPFKTGGNNLLPIATGGLVLMPVLTGGVMPLQTTGGVLPISRTGGAIMPQTTFGAQLTGGVLPVQKTANGLIPAPMGMHPQTTFGTPAVTHSFTGGLMPLQRTGGALPAQQVVPQTTFGAPQVSNMLTGGAMPLQKTGGMLSVQSMPTQSFSSGPISNSFGGALPLQMTGGAMPMQAAPPQTTFLSTGNVMMPMQRTGGALPMQLPLSQGTASGLPLTQYLTGGMMPLQRTGGMLQMQSLPPQTTFGNLPLSQTRTTGQMGFQNANTTNPAMVNNMSFGGFQQNPQTNLGMQGTGAMAQLPQTTFGSDFNQVTNNMQNMQIGQTPLQNQPTGFGFGNGPQTQPIQGQANLYNASASNPFGF